MKFISFVFLSFVLLSNHVIAETILTKSQMLKQSRRCLKDSQNPVCEELIIRMEQMQLVEYEQNRFKCQSSILGLQTELVEAYFFLKGQKRRNGIMIPYVIKNC